MQKIVGLASPVRRLADGATACACVLPSTKASQTSIFRIHSASYPMRENPKEHQILFLVY
jgi:hypothetical protein